MIRVGKKSELFSDVFINFCYRNMQIELCNKKELCWQIPWIFFMADIHIEHKVLCIGNENKCIKKIVKNQLISPQTIIVNEDEISSQDEKFDVIIGTGCTEKIISYQNYLRDGGKFVITDEIKFNSIGIDLSFLREILSKSSLRLYRKSIGFNPVNFQYVFDHQSDDLIVLKDKIFFGIVFFKNYNVSNIIGKKFAINKRRNCCDKPNVILDYLEIDQDKTFKQIKDNRFYRYFFIPKELGNKSYFSIKTLQEIYHTDCRSALDLINELLCFEYIVQYNGD